MTEAHLLVQDLALVLSVAAVVSLLFHLVRQPPALGYLLAGCIVGPHVPIPLFADPDRVQTLAELGVILVMFSIGLELRVGRIARLLTTAGLVVAIEISGMMWLGYAAARLFGWSGIEGLFTGSLIAISSTMIVSRALANIRADRKLSELVLGILVVQDLAAILLLAVLTVLGAGGGMQWREVGATAAHLATFLGVALVLGLVLVPRAVRHVAATRSPETLLVASIGFCFALAFLAHRSGFSIALGAFLAGALIAEAGVGEEVKRLAAPLRDLFGAVFFVAIGMMVDPEAILGSWLPVLCLGALVIIGQSALVSAGGFLAGIGLRDSIRAGLALAQVGEFSFVIATLGVESGAARSSLYSIAVGVAALTSFATPWMVRGSSRFASAVERRLPHPVQSFAALYAAWWERIRARGRPRSRAARLRRVVGLLALDGALLATLVIAAAEIDDLVCSRLAARGGAPPAAVHALVVVAAAVIAIPFALGMWRAARGLGTAVAARVLPLVRPGEIDLGAAPRRAFLLGIQLMIMMLLGLPLMALTQAFVPVLVAVPAFALLLAGAGLGFWRSLRGLEEHVRAGAHVVVEALLRSAHAGASDDAALHEVERMLPGLGTFVAIEIDPGAAAIGRTLIDLDLRSATGASVLAIIRDGKSIVAPSGREVLRERDLLGLSGTTDAIAAASALLRGSG